MATPERLIILTNERQADNLRSIAEALFDASRTLVVTNADELDEVLTPDVSGARLVAFGTGVIVPGRMISQLDVPPINIHPASREFPGRDPHHFAAYRGVEVYGATSHFMATKVDAGPIIDERLVPVNQDAAPHELLEIAEDQGTVLFEALVEILARGQVPSVRSDLEWGALKTTRLDFQRLCLVPLTVSGSELRRRLKSTSFPGHDNLVANFDGLRMRLSPVEGSDPLETANERWADFSEDGYRCLIQQAKSEGYQFVRFGEAPLGRHVLWRHDVDYSVHRSLSLAEIEKSEGVRSTFFFCLHLPFYNMLEKPVRDAARRIVNLGHDVGLHFDASYYDHITNWTIQDLDRLIAAEASILADILDADVRAVSFHDPTAGNFLAFDQAQLGGLENAYGSRLRSNYTYCSDSNGHWRHERISDVIAKGHERLQILTHPAWWLPEAMPPRWRIERAVMGRARAVMQEYDEHLARSGRENLD